LSRPRLIFERLREEGSKMSAETLQTERLRLRAPAVSDAERLAQLANDAAVARMSTRIPHPYALSDAEAFLDYLTLGEEQVFAIEHGDEGLVGMIGLHDTGRVGPEVGYWLGQPYWGRGLATEAARGVLGWAARRGRRCVVSSHFADNPASGAVLIKAGFLYTGEVTRAFSKARGREVDTRHMVWLA
jgi:RimJ/RimL family protein N-acetyltransferase